MPTIVRVVPQHFLKTLVPAIGSQSISNVTLLHVGMFDRYRNVEEIVLRKFGFGPIFDAKMTQQNIWGSRKYKHHIILYLIDLSRSNQCNIASILSLYTSKKALFTILFRCASKT